MKKHLKKPIAAVLLCAMFLFVCFTVAACSFDLIASDDNTPNADKITEILSDADGAAEQPQTDADSDAESDTDADTDSPDNFEEEAGEEETQEVEEEQQTQPRRPSVDAGNFNAH